MSIIKITSENFEQEVLKEEKPVLIDFYADWCGPCKMMSPIIDAIAEEVDGKVKVGKVNIDDNQNLAVKYQIMSIPTIVLFKKGEIAESFVGVTDKSEIMQVLSK